MANGQDFYAHGAVPAHAIMDASYFRKYSWGFRMGAVPKVWHDSGFLKSAPTLRELAAKIGVDPDGLEATVARFNGFAARSEEHTSELQSLMRISYAVFCLKKKNQKIISNM